MNSDAKIVPKPEIELTELNGESVLLNIQDGNVYGLDEIGTILWGELNDGSLFSEWIRSCLDDFDISYDMAKTELEIFVERLLSLGLVKIDDC